MVRATMADSLSIPSPKRVSLMISWRPSLWFACLGLTALILAYPVNLRLEPFVVWSPDIFPNLPLFAALFYLWMASLLVLLFTPANERAATWERLALVALAALVFRGFWNVIAPVQGQASVHATATRVWQSLGRIDPHPGAGYIEWPGVSLASSALSQVTGLELSPTIAVLTVLISVTVGITAYVFLLGALKSSLHASLASLLIIAGNLAMIIYHTAGPTAIVFVVLFLAVLFQKGSLGTPPRMLVALLLLTGAAITHLSSAMLFFFFTLGLWGLGLLKGRQPVLQPNFTSLMLFFTIPVAWILFWSFSGPGFYWIVRGVWAFYVDPLDIWGRLTGAFTIGGTNFGESAPRWYSLTRLSWLTLLYTAGGLLWLWSLMRFRRLELTESMLAGVFSGLALMSALGSLVSPRGFGELLRGLTYAPFFTAPFLFLYLHRLKPWLTKAALLALAVALFALSLPTFLADNYLINVLAPHRSEYSASEWLRSLYGTGRGLQLFMTHPVLGPIQFNLFDATYITDVEAETSGYTQESRLQAVDELLDRYDSFTEEGDPGLFIDSSKMAVVSSMTFGIPVDYPQWEDMTNRLLERHSEIYNNGPMRIFAR